MSTMIQRTRAYTEAFRDGMLAACNHMPRGEACQVALALATPEGDAFLAGYYAELRRMRLDSDGASL